MHDYLNKFWKEQAERIEKEAKLDSSLGSIALVVIVLVVVLGSFILTPIGGGGIGLILYFALKSAKEIKGGSEFHALKYKTVQKLLKKKNSEILILKSKELANAQDAFSVLEKLLSRREKDLKELETNGYDITHKQLLFKNCKVELQQINASLKIATEKNMRLENKVLKENIHKEELNKVHRKEVETHKKEVNDRLELLEKAYGAGIINKAEYKKQKLQLLD